jgi:hypothetical protein
MLTRVLMLSREQVYPELPSGFPARDAGHGLSSNVYRLKLQIQKPLCNMLFISNAGCFSVRPHDEYSLFFFSMSIEALGPNTQPVPTPPSNTAHPHQRLTPPQKPRKRPSIPHLEKASGLAHDLPLVRLQVRPQVCAAEVRLQQRVGLGVRVAPLGAFHCQLGVHQQAPYRLLVAGPLREGVVLARRAHDLQQTLGDRGCGLRGLLSKTLYS